MEELVDQKIEQRPAERFEDGMLDELVLASMIERGLSDSDAGRIIITDDLREKIQTWAT